MSTDTHVWIINRAIEILARSRDSRRGRMAEWMVKHRDRVLRGNHDADRIEPFCNKGWYKWYYGRLFTSHFYDPDSMTNWRGKHSPTARTEGNRYFEHAGELLRRGDCERAFYSLGVSLHYLTDITMPLHAANFTYLDSNPKGYHTAAERYAATFREEFRVTDDHLHHSLQHDSDAGHWIHRAAVKAKAAFPLLWNPEIERWWQSKQTARWQEAIRQVLGEQLAEAQRVTAGYIDLWFQCQAAVLVRTPVHLDPVHLSDAAASKPD